MAERQLFGGRRPWRPRPSRQTYQSALGLERLAVAYRADAEISAAAMEAALRQRFTGLAVTRTRRWPAFPLTETGKIDRQALQAGWLDD